MVPRHAAKPVCVSWIIIESKGRCFFRGGCRGCLSGCLSFSAIPRAPRIRCLQREFVEDSSWQGFLFNSNIFACAWKRVSINAISCLCGQLLAHKISQTSCLSQACTFCLPMSVVLSHTMVDNESFNNIKRLCGDGIQVPKSFTKLKGPVSS